MPRTITIPASSLSTSQDIVREVTKLAKKLMASEPELTLAQARVKVWEANPALAKRYQELLAGEEKVAPAKKAASPGFARPLPLEERQPGAVVLEEVEEKARAFQKRDPSLTHAQARTRVWEVFTELAEKYQREIRT